METSRLRPDSRQSNRNLVLKQAGDQAMKERPYPSIDRHRNPDSESNLQEEACQHTLHYPDPYAALTSQSSRLPFL